MSLVRQADVTDECTKATGQLPIDDFFPQLAGNTLNTRHEGQIREIRPARKNCSIERSP
jgi:hypothetical protein